MKSGRDSSCQGLGATLHPDCTRCEHRARVGQFAEEMMSGFTLMSPFPSEQVPDQIVAKSDEMNNGDHAGDRLPGIGYRYSRPALEEKDMSTSLK